MKNSFCVVLAATVSLASCAKPPTIGRRIAYDPPRWPRVVNLKLKATTHEASTLALVDHVGLLLFMANLPWGPPGDTTNPNYRQSHFLADAPAWQGYLMAAFGFKLATLTREGPGTLTPAQHAARLAAADLELRRLAGAYPYFYAMTGEPGLIGRSMLPGYTSDRPIHWMLRSAGTDTSWVRSPTTGEWWRDNVSKDHLNLAVMGCAIPLALERNGEIVLTPQTRDALTAAMLPIVQRLVGDGYVIIDHDGKPTQHSDMGPNILIFPNGFNRTMSLQMLASAAPYDPAIATEYEQRVQQWTPAIGPNLKFVGDWVLGRGHWNRSLNIGHSDTQALAMAVCSFLIQESRPGFAQHVKDGLAGWWTFMQFELNPLYTLVYAHFVEQDPAEKQRLTRQVLEELWDFPMEKTLAKVRNRPPFGVDPDLLNEAEDRRLVKTPRVIQPLINQPVDRNQWKADPFLRLTDPEERNPNVKAAGMDYLLAYWMGRYFELIKPTDTGE